MSLQSFTNAYIEAMLWSSTDDEDEPLDRNYDALDIAPEAMERIEADCARFYEAFAYRDDFECTRSRYTADEQAGHDFWLTRNGHGAGFWDGDWLEPFATEATDACKEYGELWPYVGDDGLIYIS